MGTSRVIAFALVTAGLVGCASPVARRDRALARAAAAEAVGNLAQAETELLGYLEFAPHDVAVRTRLAAVYDRLGQPGEGLRLLADLPAYVTLDLAARQQLGRLLLANGELLRCAPILVALDAEGALEPDLGRRLVDAAARSECAAAVGRMLPLEWQRALVRRCLGTGDPERSAACLDLLPASDPERPGLTDTLLSEVLGRDDLDLLRRHTGLLEPPDSGWKLVAGHRLLVVDGRQAEAAEVEEIFLRRYPEHPARCTILIAMAQRQIRSGQLEAGLRQAEEAARLEPSSTEALLLEGRALAGLGHEKRALEVFEMLLDLDPHHPVASRVMAASRDTANLDLRLALRDVAGSP